ncbi:hypothetical protein Cpha266_2550 [Chlorobium phaeobacteroides DSM 266]|jgi:3'-phosphoadenosine 5'-phosphosulfate sulfotransferase (PAPS reductase)/FAD synthetase|uniref:Uncharacterized protein n=1 Tax=Chlorobium phaeobacteroides (strain DSM 266 / SMG 266 / 2430) TaxID=290317 RepID=A1BJG1_CHLPD|nr:hypothetical protein Cpha266_2550 [Chlorobium phaeobacteroides DSM 266]
MKKYKPAYPEGSPGEKRTEDRNSSLCAGKRTIGCAIVPNPSRQQSEGESERKQPSNRETKKREIPFDFVFIFHRGADERIL